MSINLFKLVGEISVEGLAVAIKGIQTLETAAIKALKPIDKFGKQVSGLGRDITQGITLPIVAASGVILKFGTDFEKAMTNSLAIMEDVSTETRKQMEDTAKVVSGITTSSSKQAAEAYFFLASAGLNAAQSIEALPRVAKFAQAGNFNLALATDLLTDAQSALGLSSKNTIEAMTGLTRVSDVLVKANTLANASVLQFSESLTNKAGAALRLLGKDVEEGVAVLAAFANQGLKGAGAGEALNIVLRDLQKAALKNKSAFEDAKIAVFDNAGEMRNMADIISELEARLSGMSDEQKRAELTLLGFQDKSISATMNLLGTSEAIRDYEKALKGAAGTTDKVAQKQLKSLSAQLAIMRNRLVNAAISLSDTLIPIIKNQFLPLIEAGIKRIQRFADWFGSLSQGVKTAVVEFSILFATLGPILVVMGTMISSVKMITTVFTAAKLAVVAFNAVLLSNPFGIIALAVVTLGAAITGLVLKYQSLQKEHKKFSLQTTEEAERQGFIKGVNDLIQKLRDYGDAVKDEAGLTKHLGKEIEALTAQARGMGFVIEGNNLVKLEAVNLISQELAGVMTVNGELVKYTNETKKSTEVKKKHIEVLELEITTQELLRQKRNEVIDDYERRLNQIILTEEGLLDLEEAQAIAKLTDLQASEAHLQNVRDYYSAIRIQREIDTEKRIGEENQKAHEEKLKLQEIADRKHEAQTKREEDREKRKYQTIVSFATRSINQIFSIFSMSTDNKIAKIDLEAQKQKELAEHNITSESDKEAKIAKIEEVADKRKKELMIRQAKRDKVAAIFNAGIAATQLAINGFKTQPFLPLGIIMGSIATTLGLGLVAAIAAKPLPALAEGGLIRQRSGGVQAIVGEGGDDELVLPMRKGAHEIANRIVDRMEGVSSPSSGGTRPTRGRAGGERNQRKQIRPIQHVWNIGTLVADDEGIKELERRQLSFRVAEEQRKGED